MTYSIIARDPKTGYFGAAVASRFFAVGAVIPFISKQSAVATQALVNPVWGIEGNQLMQAGHSPEQAIAKLKERDNGQAQRQVHMIDKSGQTAAHTGKQCIDWAGDMCRQDVSVAGNMLAGPAVLKDMLACYMDNMALDFAPRLLCAMEAAEAAGGDKRGRQSAALRIHRGEEFAWLDLRADDHAHPLNEVRRLLDVAQERYIHFTDMMGSSDNISGHADRAKIETAIAEAAEKRGDKPTASLASDP